MITAILPRFTHLVVLAVALLPFLPGRAVAQVNGGACGDGDAAVIFLHDQLQDATSFDGLWPAMCEEENIRAVRYDRRGYGQSPESAEPYSDTTDLALVLQNLGITQATLVTSGTAAGIALKFAQLYPDAVNGLVLSSPSLSGSAQSQDSTAMNTITVPALILIGATGTSENIARAQAVSGTLPNSDIVVMLSASYYIEIERPTALAQYVIGFVKGLAP